eukprot:jgi/Mesen1/2372/ME000156S01518
MTHVRPAEGQPAHSGPSSTLETLRTQWKREQAELCRKLVTSDDFTWTLPPPPPSTPPSPAPPSAPPPAAPTTYPSLPSPPDGSRRDPPRDGLLVPLSGVHGFLGRPSASEGNMRAGRSSGAISDDDFRARSSGPSGSRGMSPGVISTDAEEGSASSSLPPAQKAAEVSPIDERAPRSSAKEQEQKQEQEQELAQEEREHKQEQDEGEEGGARGTAAVEATAAHQSLPGGTGRELQYVGGVDISFRKEDPNDACAALVVLELTSMEVVYEAYERITMDLPYMAGFLAFRECPVLVRLLEQLRCQKPHLVPQVLLVDGNGVLHPRGFGLACHLGVVADIPTIGVGKNMHHVDGLSAESVRQLAAQQAPLPGQWAPLVGRSRRTWGAVVCSAAGSSKPLFVSVGHRISLESAVQVVSRCCLYRVPEPIRQADQRSRQHLRDFES